MEILIACEYSGITRRAFKKLGHNVISCDLLQSEDNSPDHYQGDIRDLIAQHWDLMIAHPPCTDLAVSGSRWFKEKIEDGRQAAALEFVRMLMDADIDKICLENPISVISTKVRKPDQIIQPWMFGHTETKATCLWLKGLPKLRETDNVKIQTMALPINKRSRIHYMTPGPDRWKERSRTFTGIADAFANQWGTP